MTLALVVAGTVLTGALLVRLQLAHVRRTADQRRRLLWDVRHVLERSEVVQRGVDYPVLTGLHDGVPVTVAVIVDTVALRELPTLWLSITRRQPLPLSGPVDLLLRPSSTDIVSPGERFPAVHPVPAGWPEHLRVATPSGGRPDFQQLSGALPLLEDVRTKDVLITPSGARVVTRLSRAEVGHYRLFKRPRFEATLTGSRLAAELDAVRALATATLDGAEESRAACEPS